MRIVAVSESLLMLYTVVDFPTTIKAINIRMISRLCLRFNESDSSAYAI